MTTCSPSSTTLDVGSFDVGRLDLGRAALGAATTLAGLAAGFFFTYQISVTRGLAIVDDGTYVQSFQAINDTVRNVPFGIVFFGTVPAIALAAILHRGRARHTRVLIVSALVLAIATVVITFAGSVPLNEELATAASTPIEAQAARADFELRWNRLNLARTLTSIGAAVALVVAAVSRPRRAPSAG